MSTDGSVAAAAGSDRDRSSGEHPALLSTDDVIAVCDGVLGEVGRREHLFTWLRRPRAGYGDWLAVDAYYPRRRIVVLSREVSAEEEQACAKLVPEHGLRLLRVRPEDLRDEHATPARVLADLVTELESRPARAAPVAGRPRLRSRWRFGATLARPRSHAGLAEAPTPYLLTAAAAAACVAAPLLVALDAPVHLRFAAMVAVFSLAPGVALISWLRGRMEFGLLLATSMAATAVIAQSMLWFDLWQPRPFLYGLSVVCLPPLLIRLRPSLKRGPSLPRRVLSVVSGTPRVLTLHVALLSGAVSSWAISLTATHMNRMAGLGLLNAVPPTYFVALALLLVGFSVAVTRDPTEPKLLAIYTVALLVVLYGTIPLLYQEPRFPWSYKHFGVIELLSANGTAQRKLDIYNNWPAFFAINAWLKTATGLAPISYAEGSQLFFGLANAAAVLFVMRGVTGDRRLQWTATWLFVLGNWVQPTEEDLAPQAFALVLSLVILGLCLRCARRGTESGMRWDLVPLRWLDRLFNKASSRSAPPDSLAPAPLAPRAAIFVGGLCFLAVVISHQLSPIMLIVSVTALSLLLRRLPFWIPAAMAAIEAWWLALAWPLLSKIYLVINPGLPGAAPAARKAQAAPPHAALSFYAPAAVVAAISLLAVVGGVRRLRAGHRDVVPGVLAVAVIPVALVQSYGGIGLYRAYLFALPWVAFFAAAAFGSGPSHGWRQALLRWVPLAGATCAVAACLLIAVFGQDLGDRLTTDEVQAETWVELHAPPGSTIVNGTGGPVFLTRRYPLIGDEVQLLDTREFTGHVLGPPDVANVARFFDKLRPAFHQFLILSRRQDDYARLNGITPAGSLPSLARALERSAAFRLVYHRPTAWAFEFLHRSAPTAPTRRRT